MMKVQLKLMFVLPQRREVTAAKQQNKSMYTAD